MRQLVTFAIAFWLLVPVLGLAEQPSVIEAARKRFPNVVWRNAPLLTGDFNCDHKSDVAMLGISASEVIVAVFQSGTKNRPDSIAFPISRFNVATIEFQLERLDTTDKEFEEMIGRRPDGLKKSRRCIGFNLSDGEKDSAHIYWNHQRNEFSAWSL